MVEALAQSPGLDEMEALEALRLTCLPQRTRAVTAERYFEDRTRYRIESELPRFALYLDRGRRNRNIHGISFARDYSAARAMTEDP